MMVNGVVRIIFTERVRSYNLIRAVKAFVEREGVRVCGMSHYDDHSIMVEYQKWRPDTIPTKLDEGPLPGTFIEPGGCMVFGG